MKRFYNFKTLMAIAVMFFMATAVYAETRIAFHVHSPTDGANLHYARQLGSFAIGSDAAAWTVGQDSIFFNRNNPTDNFPAAVGHQQPGVQASTNADFINSGLLDCIHRPGTQLTRRLSSATNLYTFKFGSTDVSALTLRFINNATTGAPQPRHVVRVRTGSDRANLTTLTLDTDFTLIGNPFTSMGPLNTAQTWTCNTGVVTIAGLSIPVGNYIEVVIAEDAEGLVTGSAQLVQAIVTPMPTGEPSLFIDRIVVAETVLPEAEFRGAGPFTYLLQRTADESPNVSIYVQTPSYVTITVAQGLEGVEEPIAHGDYFYISIPVDIYTDTIVFRVTGTAGAVTGQTATYLVIFQKDTVNIAVVPTETVIPAAGNLALTFNKDVFVIDGVEMDEIVEINGEAVAVTLVGRVLTIPYTLEDWDNFEMEVVILAGTLRDAVLEPNATITLNFEQNMANPAITGATVGGANLQGATGMQTSLAVNLVFDRTDVVRNLDVPIRLNTVTIPEESIVGTTIDISGLSFATTHTIEVPAGAFVVESNTALTTQAAFTVSFTTAAFQVPLAGYRSITGGNFRAMRRIENARWARGEHAYSGDSIWFFRYDETIGFHPHPVNTGTEGFTQAGNGLFESMLSPVRFSGATPQPHYLPFDDNVDFMEANPQKIRMMHNGARRFIIRAGSSDITELALNMIHNTGTQAAGSFAATFISEIYISNDRLALVDNDPQADAVEFFERVTFTSAPVEIRGSGSIPANGGAFMLVANLNQTIPQGSFIRLTIDGGQNPTATNPGEPSNQVLVEALFTPSPAFLEASYLITSVTQTNAAGVVIQGNESMPTEFIASVNFGSNSLVQRNPDVDIRLNGAVIDADYISHTFISIAGLTQEADYTLAIPAGAWISVANPAWVSPAQTITFSTGDPASIVRPEDVPVIAAETVSIFPNPVSDILYVTAENMQTIEIMDMLGRTVLTRATNNSRESIDVSGLREGLYFIRITKTTGEIVVMRFVKN